MIADMTPCSPFACVQTVAELELLLSRHVVGPQFD